MRHFPFAQEDEFVPLWLWTEKAGVFSHETALHLHGLLDVLPARHQVTVPMSWRRRRLRVPAEVALHFGDLSPADVAWHGRVPVTAPLRTLLDCAASNVQPDMLEAATAQALARGLVVPKALDSASRQVGSRRPRSGPTARQKPSNRLLKRGFVRLAIWTVTRQILVRERFYSRVETVMGHAVVVNVGMVLRFGVQGNTRRACLVSVLR